MPKKVKRLVNRDLFEAQKHATNRSLAGPRETGTELRGLAQDARKGERSGQPSDLCQLARRSPSKQTTSLNLKPHVQSSRASRRTGDLKASSHHEIKRIREGAATYPSNLAPCWTCQAVHTFTVESFKCRH